MSDTLMAIIAACAIIAAVLMAGLAYRLNEKWGEREKSGLRLPISKIAMLSIKTRFVKGKII